MATILGTIDIGGDGKEVLLASLNYKLGTNFTLDDFEFGTPSAVTMPSPTHNTQIKLGPKAHSGYYGNRTIYYNRVHVSQLGTITVAKGTATKVSHLLQKINEKYGILITELDIYDALLPDIPPGETNITLDLNFRPTSIIFYGGTQIILGNNDPAAGGGAGVSLPFSGKWMFFAESIRDDVLDSYSVQIDQDRSRKRVSSTIVGNTPHDLGLMFQRTVEVSEEGEYFGHIVGAWSDPLTGVIRALNIYGHVLQRVNGTFEWEKVGEAYTVDMQNPNTVNMAQVERASQFVVQSNTGEVIVFNSKNPGTSLMTSTDNGDSWNEITISGQAALIDENNWTQKKFTLLDKVIVGAYIFLLVHHDDGINNGLKVYRIEIATGNADIYHIDNNNIQNTAQTLDVTNYKNIHTSKTAIKGSFVSTEDALLTHPNLVLLASVKDSVSAEVFWCKFDTATSKYLINTTTDTGLFIGQKNYNGSFISAYSLPLEKDANKSLDVIEIGTMSNSDSPDFEMFVAQDRIKTENGFFGHAFIALTSVREAGQRNNWIKTSFALSKGSYPQRIIFSEQTKRTHYVFQPETGIFQLSFNEDNDVAGFIPVNDPERSIMLEAHTAYNRSSKEGIGTSPRPDIIETSNTNYSLTTYSNQESSLPDVKFSFITKTPDEKKHWLNAPSAAATLVERTISKEYRFAGTTPIAVFNIGTDIYAVAEGNKGIFKRDIAGKRWSYYGALSSYFKPVNSLTYIGWSRLELKAENILGIITDPATGVSYLRVKVQRNIDVIDASTNSWGNAKALYDEALVHIDTNIGKDPNTFYIEENEHKSFGFNAASQYSPRRFDFITPKSDGSYSYKLHYSIASDYDQEFVSVTIPAGFPATNAIYDVREEVAYLNIKALWFIETSSGVTQIVQQATDDTLTTYDLNGGANPPTSAFKPTLVFNLYDSVDANYVPLVYYGNKKAYLMGRLKEDGTFDKTLHTLTIPSDNGADLTVIPVLSSNRQEYLFAQKGNGIFKLNYAYNAATKTANLTLVKLFGLNVGFDTHEVISACLTSNNNVVHPTVALIPTYPANGTLLNTYCSGTTQMGQYADGVGGTYNDTIAVNSAACGYVAPPPGTLAADAVTLTASMTFVDVTNLTHSSVQAGEDGSSAYVKYTLADALADDVVLDVSLNYITATAADINTMTMQMGASAAVPITYPGTVTIPAGETTFKLNFTFVPDTTTEGDETFKIVVATQAGETHVSNDTPIETIVTIIDTSKTP